MAITGTGTKDDPYIVHNYDELKEKYTEENGSSMEWYIKLVNDIDCNDLGDDWEWTAMTRGYGNKHIDLDGHTIKNIMIKSGSSLFFDANGSTYIYNGKILNVFNNGATDISNGVKLNNVSISVNGTGLTGVAFSSTIFENCAVYFKSNKLNNSVFYCRTYPYCKNSDFYLDINDKNSKGIFTNYSAEGASQLLDNCRVRGYIGGKSDQYYLLSGSCNNSVIEVDTTNMSWESSFGSAYHIPCGASSTGIINTEISPNLSGGTSGLTACTSAQMRDPDYLNSIGFNVVKVGG